MTARRQLLGGAALAAAAIVACSSGEAGPGSAGPPAAARGPARREPKPSPLVQALELAGGSPQVATPARALSLVLDGFHVVRADAGRPAEQQRQVRVSHDCAAMNPEFVQCAVFDGDGEDAHLVGVEYVISARLHEALPRDEQLYWHAHAGEVDAGLLIAPGLAEPAQAAVLGLLRPTFGKTWRLWDSTRDVLPIGEPALMWSIAPLRINRSTRAAMTERALR